MNALAHSISVSHWNAPTCSLPEEAGKEARNGKEEYVFEREPRNVICTPRCPLMFNVSKSPILDRENAQDPDMENPSPCSVGNRRSSWVKSSSHSPNVYLYPNVGEQSIWTRCTICIFPGEKEIELERERERPISDSYCHEILSETISPSLSFP